MTYKPFEPAPLTAFGDSRIAELSPIIQQSFEYTVDNAKLSSKTEVNGGTVTQANAMAVVGTSTTTASKATYSSKHHAKYHPGFGGLARFTAMFTTPVAVTEQFAGLADEVGSTAAFKNGYVVGYDGTTFGFHRFQNDALFTAPQSSWDDPLDGTGPSGMTLDTTKLNVFYIQMQYLGAGAVKLFVEDEATGGIILVHTLDYVNQNTVPHIYQPTLKFIFHADNKATANNLVVSTASLGYFVEGKTGLIELHQPLASSGEQLKGGITAERAVCTIRNKTTYATRANFIDALILGFYGSSEAGTSNNLAYVRLVKNATLGGTPVYNDINTTDSIIEIDVAGTTVTGGEEIHSIPLGGRNGTGREDLSNWGVILNPGDTITVAGESRGNADIAGGITWKELF